MGGSGGSCLAAVKASLFQTERLNTYLLKYSTSLSVSSISTLSRSISLGRKTSSVKWKKRGKSDYKRTDHLAWLNFKNFTNWKFSKKWDFTNSQGRADISHLLVNIQVQLQNYGTHKSAEHNCGSRSHQKRPDTWMPEGTGLYLTHLPDTFPWWEKPWEDS